MTTPLPRSQRLANVSARNAAPWMLIVGIALVALVLRGPIVAVAPVLGDIRTDLSLAAWQGGLLTSIPVLCFSLVTPVAVWVIGRFGADVAVTVCVIGVGFGSIIRSADGVGTAFLGTVLIGAFITIGNVVMPVVIRRDFTAGRVSMATGTYTAALNIGSTITSLATAPLADQFGWRIALVTWAGFSVLAVLGWAAAIGSRRAFVSGGERTDFGSTVAPGKTDTAEAAVPTPRVWRSLTIVMLTAAFSGQAFSYYGVTAWLPSILRDTTGMTIAESGAASSIFQVGAVVGALSIPLAIERLRPVGAATVVTVFWLAVPLGLILAPANWALWCSLGGIAQGGGITVVFVLIARFATSSPHASRLSASVQGVGYGVAAISPTLLGLLHDSSDAWTVPLIAVTVAILVFGSLCALASRRDSRSRR